MKYFHDILTKVDNDKNIKNLFEKVETWPRSIEEKIVIFSSILVIIVLLLTWIKN